MLEHKAQRPPDRDYKPYQMQPFPRAEVAAELARRCPQVAPQRADNLMQRFFTQQAAGAGKVAGDGIPWMP